MLVVLKRSQLLLLPFLVSLAACATNGPLLGTGITSMRDSVESVRTRSGEAFDDINASRREFAIEDVLDANRPPKESDFAPVIAADTVGRWSAAFDQLDAYLAALQLLIDAKRSAETEQNLSAIGTALQSPTIGATLPKGSEGVFALFGLAVQAAAEKKALDAMRATDPAFQQLMRKMADLVSGDPEAGLAAMVTGQWGRRLRDIATDDYGAAAERGSREGRAAAITDFGRALDQRNAKLRALADLRESLMALGEAHAAAARGSDGALFYWIGLIDTRLKNARERAEQGGN